MGQSRQTGSTGSGVVGQIIITVISHRHTNQHGSQNAHRRCDANPSGSSRQPLHLHPLRLHLHLHLLHLTGPLPLLSVYTSHRKKQLRARNS